MNPGPSPLTKSSILATLRNHEQALEEYSVTRIGLFGSFARDEQGPESDIDLVVEFAEPTYDNLYGLSEFLEALLGRRVEILTPAALEHIRVPAVARSIRESLVYV